MGRVRWVWGVRRQVVVLAVVTLLGLLLLLNLLRQPATTVQIGKYQDFRFSTHQTEQQTNRHLRYFKRVDRKDIFLYSAIANHLEPSDGDLNIIISGFDSTSTDALMCCVVTKGDKLVTTQSSVFYRFYNEPSFIGPYVQSFYTNTPTKAKQYACVVPEFGLEATHVTMTSSATCPEATEDYLPVVYPKIVPGGLAICGKAAFGDMLDPNKLMEWFEIQRLLGVDHIQIMDAGNPESVRKVFSYYTQIGLLDLLPYELPGVPYGRGLDYKRFVRQQGDHDKSFPILDCTQRLKGYTFVLGIDMDEMLIPARNVPLKDFAKEKFMAHPDAAGFFFYTQFFVYDWGPTSNKSDISFFRYLNSTRPRNECKKYIYLTKRIFQARTHDFTPKSPYTQYWVPEEEAVLHHYRQCPKNVWKTCFPPRIHDPSLLRLQGALEERVKVARKATGIGPA